MTIKDFAVCMAGKAEAMIARRYGVTTVTAEGDELNPSLHIVNQDFNLDQSVPVAGPYEDFTAHGEADADTYAEALVFEVEYALFEMLNTNNDVSRYADFETAGEMLYTKLLDVDRSQGMIQNGVLGRRVDEYSILALYIHDGHTKTMVDKTLMDLWQIAPAALFIKAAENTGH